MFSAAKATSFVAALVSMLTLENAMLSAFATDSTLGFRQLTLALTGVAIVFIIFTIAICMISRSTRELREMKEGHSNGK